MLQLFFALNALLIPFSCRGWALWVSYLFWLHKMSICSLRIRNLLSHFEFEIRDTNQEPLNEIMREKRDFYFSVLPNTNLKFGKTDVNLISLMSDHVSLFWSDMIRSRSPLNANWIVTKKLTGGCNSFLFSAQKWPKFWVIHSRNYHLLSCFVSAAKMFDSLSF